MNLQGKVDGPLSRPLGITPDFRKYSLLGFSGFPALLPVIQIFRFPEIRIFRSLTSDNPEIRKKWIFRLSIPQFHKKVSDVECAYVKFRLHPMASPRPRSPTHLRFSEGGLTPHRTSHLKFMMHSVPQTPYCFDTVVCRSAQ